MARILPPLRLRTRAELFTQLAALETAGLPPDKAFSMIRLEVQGQPRIEAARKLLARGLDPAQAGEKSSLFTQLEVRVVSAALQGGSPAAVYRRLGETYTTRAAQVAKIKSRMLLPGFTLVLGLLLNPLPALFAATISVGGYFWQVLKPLIFLYALLQVALRLPRWLHDTEAEDAIDAFVPKIPWIGPMLVRRNARDFFQALAMLLEAGVPMFDALPPAVDTIANIRMRHQYEALVDAVRGGATFAQALRMLPYLANSRVLDFVQTGEASGTLPDMLYRHVQMETGDIDLFYEQLTTWVPRVVYTLVALWSIVSLLSGPGIMTKVPDNI
jgi:general secretion pathway protein F